MEKDKTILMSDFVSLEMEFQIKPEKFLELFFMEIYKALQEFDEVIIDEKFSEDFYSIKRTPMIDDVQTEVGKEEVIFAGDEATNNFKVFLTRRKK